MVAATSTSNNLLGPDDGWTKVATAAVNVNIKSNGSTKAWYVYCVSTGGAAPTTQQGYPMGNSVHSTRDTFAQTFSTPTDVYVRATAPQDAKSKINFATVASNP